MTEARKILTSQGVDVEAVDAMSYSQIEGTIARSTDEFAVRCYQPYLGGLWNEGYFESEEDKGYCWNLINYCAQRRREIEYPASLSIGSTEGRD